MQLLLFLNHNNVLLYFFLLVYLRTMYKNKYCNFLMLNECFVFPSGMRSAMFLNWRPVAAILKILVKYGRGFIQH